MGSSCICLVTIHGIGFEQPPLPGVNGGPDTPGYADDLHTGLTKQLGEGILSDDPGRQPYQHGESVPIYVQSVWPPDTHQREAGVSRLGTWDEHHLRTVDGSQAPLTDGKAPLAHVALVYSQLEEQNPQIDAALIAGSMTVFSLGHYTHVRGLVHMLLLDFQPLWEHLPHDNNMHGRSSEITPSLRIRQDPGFKRHEDTSKKQSPPPTGVMALIRQLENDVAAYVCHNEMRERVRSFVLDALLRLACRDDVAGIVINAHSNGTVIALDTLRQLPPFAAKKVLALITAGSPLRKYTDLFTWGQHLATMPKIGQWTNFWDERDPVADPLRPSVKWRRGMDLKKAELTGLYQAIDPNTGKISSMDINDIPVDNITHSRGGGLLAHNYWDNEKEFLKPLADILTPLVTSRQIGKEANFSLDI